MIPNNELSRYCVFGKTFTQIKDEEKKLVYAKSKIFLQKPQNFCYNIVVQDQQYPAQESVFKLQSDFLAHFEIQKKEQAIIIFYFPLRANKLLIIECPFTQSQIQPLGTFRELYCRAVYEEKFEQSSQKVHPDQLEDKIFCYLKKKTPSQEKQSSSIKKLQKDLNKEKSFIFFGIGFLCKGNQIVKPQIILNPAIFSIKMDGFNKYKIVVFDEGGQIKYSKQIDFQFQRQISIIDRSILWIGDSEKNQNPEIYYFEFNENEGNLITLEEVLKKMDYETQRNQALDQDSIFQQYYGGRNYPGMQIEEPFVTKNDFHFDQSFNANLNDSSLDFNKGIIKEFQQLKTKNKTLISKDDEVEIVDNQNVQNIQQINIRDQQNNIFQPHNIQMLDKDNKFVSMGEENPNKAYYTDLVKGKVIREYQDKKGQIKDLTALGGKEAVFGNNENFLTVSGANITQFDTREPDQVNSRFYKSIKNFSNIFAPKEGNYVVATDDGNLRCFDKVGGNARNMIPSYSYNKPISIDSDKSGNLMLVTFKTHLLLFPLKQDGKSAFEFTFRKNDKPKPFNLRMSPDVLVRYGMSKPEFKSAKFDEKINDTESAIIAVCGKLQVFWNLNDVLRGETVTSNVKELNEQILKSEFQFNADNIFTAFRHKWFVSKSGRFN